MSLQSGVVVPEEASMDQEMQAFHGGIPENQEMHPVLDSVDASTDRDTGVVDMVMLATMIGRVSTEKELLRVLAIFSEKDSADQRMEEAKHALYQTKPQESISHLLLAALYAYNPRMVCIERIFGMFINGMFSDEKMQCMTIFFCARITKMVASDLASICEMNSIEKSNYTADYISFALDRNVISSGDMTTMDMQTILKLSRCLRMMGLWHLYWQIESGLTAVQIRHREAMCCLTLHSIVSNRADAAKLAGLDQSFFDVPIMGCEPGDSFSHMFTEYNFGMGRSIVISSRLSHKLAAGMDVDGLVSYLRAIEEKLDSPPSRNDAYIMALLSFNSSAANSKMSCHLHEVILCLGMIYPSMVRGLILEEFPRWKMSIVNDSRLVWMMMHIWALGVVDDAIITEIALTRAHFVRERTTHYYPSVITFLIIDSLKEKIYGNVQMVGVIYEWITSAYREIYNTHEIMMLREKLENAGYIFRDLSISGGDAQWNHRENMAANPDDMFFGHGMAVEEHNFLDSDVMLEAQNIGDQDAVAASQVSRDQGAMVFE